MKEIISHTAERCENCSLWHRCYFLIARTVGLTFQVLHLQTVASSSTVLASDGFFLFSLQSEVRELESALLLQPGACYRNASLQARLHQISSFSALLRFFEIQIPSADVDTCGVRMARSWHNSASLQCN
jgi:hypothetical protein